MSALQNVCVPTDQSFFRCFMEHMVFIRSMVKSEGVEIRVVDGLVMSSTAKNWIIVYVLFCLICPNHTLNNAFFMSNEDGRKKLELSVDDWLNIWRTQSSSLLRVFIKKEIIK